MCVCVCALSKIATVKIICISGFSNGRNRRSDFPRSEIFVECLPESFYCVFIEFGNYEKYRKLNRLNSNSGKSFSNAFRT